MKTRILISLTSLCLLVHCAPAPSGPSASPSPKPVASAPLLVLPSQLPATGGLVSTSPAPASPTAAKGPTKVELSKTSFSAGEAITVHFSVDPALALDKTAWIGLIPSEVPHGNEAVNDNYDQEYHYLDGKTSGDMTFKAPQDPGNYDLRLNSSDENGTELSSVSFTVAGPAKPLTGNALALDKSRYAPGETMTITVSIKAESKLDETAWVGIVPSAVDHGSEKLNDQHNLGYKYLGKALFGKTTLPAPGAPGLYDIRLNDTDNDSLNGQELAFISFVVE
ncbi:MAG: hypothetical protein ACAI44_37575 [Candidatus Sericytochromatia bacterium]